MQDELPQLDPLHEERETLRSLWPFGIESPLSGANWYKTVRDPKPTRKYVGKASTEAKSPNGQRSITDFAREPNVNPFANRPASKQPSCKRNAVSVFARDPQVHRTTMRILPSTKMTYLQVYKLVELAKTMGVDAEGEIDPSLSYGENKAELVEKGSGAEEAEWVVREASDYDMH